MQIHKTFEGGMGKWALSSICSENLNVEFSSIASSGLGCPQSFDHSSPTQLPQTIPTRTVSQVSPAVTGFS